MIQVIMPNKTRKHFMLQDEGGYTKNLAKDDNESI